jgi:chromosome segregation ATPase
MYSTEDLRKQLDAVTRERDELREHVTRVQARYTSAREAASEAVALGLELNRRNEAQIAMLEEQLATVTRERDEMRAENAQLRADDAYRADQLHEMAEEVERLERELDESLSAMHGAMT